MPADTQQSYANVSHQPMLKPMAMAALWRHRTVKALRQWQHFLDEQGLLNRAISEQLAYAIEQLTRVHYTIAIVAEVSRGKSELINAMLFAQHGQRVVPSGAGRTTMCPTEFFCDEDVPPYLELLPIETRASAASFAELSKDPSVWQRFDINSDNTEMLQQALQKVCAKQMVPLKQAQALGFEIDSFDHILEDALLVASGSVGTMVEVPSWRYARINIHHPLLATGLAILDTPGLNVLGHEPELTYAILPTVDSVIYLLSADIGASRSDQANWESHLGHLVKHSKIAVMNKIDALNDGLRSTLDVGVDIVKQIDQAAHALNLPKSQVFAISAQQALLARIEQDDDLLIQSRLPELEKSMSTQLLEKHQEQLKSHALKALELSHTTALQSLQGLSLQTQTQIDELNGLSVSKDPAQMIATYTEETQKRLALEAALGNAIHQNMKQHWAVVKNVLGPQPIYAVFEPLIEQSHTASTSALKQQLNAAILFVLQHLDAAVAESQKAKFEGQKTLAKIKQLSLLNMTQAAKASGNNLDFPLAFDNASIEASMLTLQQELSRMAQTSSTYLPAIAFLTATHRVKAAQTFLALQQRCEQLIVQARTELTQWFEGMNQTMQTALSLHRSLLNKRTDTLARMQQAQQALSQNLSSQTAALEIFSAQMTNLTSRFELTVASIHADAPHTSSASSAQAKALGQASLIRAPFEGAPTATPTPETLIRPATEPPQTSPPNTLVPHTLGADSPRTTIIIAPDSAPDFAAFLPR